MDLKPYFYPKTGEKVALLIFLQPFCMYFAWFYGSSIRLTRSV
jgi:hypothetical protein